MTTALTIHTIPSAPALASSTPWEDVVAVYLSAAVDSENTRRAYGRHLREAFAFIGVGSVAELSGADLAGYRAHVTTSNLSPASQGQALAAMRSFLKWARTMGAHAMPTEVIATALKTPRSTVRKPYSVLSTPEVSAVIGTATNSRDRAILAVMLGAGLRVSEVVGLDVLDIVEDGEGGTSLYVRQGKGRKDRVVPIQDDVARLLRSYLGETSRRLGSEGPLFRAHDRAAAKLPRGRLHVNAVGQLVARCARVAGIDAKRVSPHSLRHTYATRHFASAKNLIALQKILGHASVTTTQRYADHFEAAELRATVPALPI